MSSYDSLNRLRPTERGVAVAVLAVLVAMEWSVRTSGQAAASDAGQIGGTAAEKLLDRARESAPGTYLVGDRMFQAAPDQISIMLQADAYRGSDRSTRVSVALGANLPRPAAVHLRIFTTGPEPRVAADATAIVTAGLARLTREFTLEPGRYDLYAAIGHSQPNGSAVAALAKSTLRVPDVWNGSLAASPIVIGDSVTRLQRAAEDRPFIFGATGLTPALSARFPQARELHVAFRVYNWSGEAGVAPDLTVEYVFYQQVGGRLRFFNKMKPQALVAGTLGQAFDAAARAVSTGVTIPLASFPLGEFELTARVTDNRSKQRLEPRARFQVGS